MADPQNPLEIPEILTMILSYCPSYSCKLVCRFWRQVSDRVISPQDYDLALMVESNNWPAIQFLLTHFQKKVDIPMALLSALNECEKHNYSEDSCQVVVYSLEHLPSYSSLSAEVKKKLALWMLIANYQQAFRQMLPLLDPEQLDETILITAIEYQRVDAIKLLLQQPAFRILDHSASDCLYQALLTNNLKIISLILQHLPIDQIEHLIEFFLPLILDPDILELFIQRQLLSNMIGDVIDCAIATDNLEVISYLLLEKRVNLNRSIFENFAEAIKYGRYEIVRFFVEKLEVNPTKKLIDQARRDGYATIYKYLLQKQG